MARGKKSEPEDKSFTSAESEEEEDEKGQPSIFQRLFMPSGSGVTSYSRSQEGESLDSETMETEGSDTRLSTLSASSSTVSDGSDGPTENTEEERELQRFDRELRARHRGACKNMTSGKYSKAIKTFEGILSDLLDRFGETHHRVGAALHNVAVANLRAGLLNDARDAIEEAVRIRKISLGEQSSKVADSLVEYGIILLSMKQYTESLGVFREAIQLRQREAHLARKSEYAQEAKLKMAKIRHNIGCVNFELGKLEEAKASYIEAIEQQKAAFGTWTTPFMIMTDTTKPGFLTMASTMCNKGYIDLEQKNYSDAITVFTESLKIQKLLLEADNKLILGTLDNIGYASCMKGDFERALKIYEELCTLQQESYGDQSQKGWPQSIRKLIYCQVSLRQWEEAFSNLEALEDYLRTRGEKGKNIVEELDKTHELMGEVNYQIFKFPTLAESANRALGCGLCSDARDDIDLSDWVPSKPANGSKMSGHRMTYA